MSIKKYFNIKELVCMHVYNRDHEASWIYFDPRLLEVVLWIREHIGKPMIVNNWASGGKYTQRGLRCNLCDLVQSKTKANILYLTPHEQGTAVDFDVVGMTAVEVRKWLFAHAAELPHPIRVEADVTWNHIDTRVSPDAKEKITLFRA